jgi:hypothetical protein
MQSFWNQGFVAAGLPAGLLFLLANGRPAGRKASRTGLPEKVREIPQFSCLVKNRGLRKAPGVVEWKCPHVGHTKPFTFGVATVNAATHPSSLPTYSIRASVKSTFGSTPLAERLRLAAAENEMTESEFIRRAETALRAA